MRNRNNSCYKSSSGPKYNNENKMSTDMWIGYNLSENGGTGKV